MVEGVSEGGSGVGSSVGVGVGAGSEVSWASVGAAPGGRVAAGYLPLACGSFASPLGGTRAAGAHSLAHRAAAALVTVSA